MDVPVRLCIDEYKIQHDGQQMSVLQFYFLPAVKPIPHLQCIAAGSPLESGALLFAITQVKSMSSRRVLKAAQAIREVVSMAILTDIKDPRVRDVTVTMVEVTPDMRQAKVNVTVRGDEAKQKLCLRGLQNSAGFFQQKVGRRIDTRYTPRLEFVIDKGLNNALAVTRILEDVIPAEREQFGETDDDNADAPTSVDNETADEAPINQTSQQSAEAE